MQVRRARTAEPLLSPDTLWIAGMFVLGGALAFIVLSVFWGFLKIVALRTRANGVIRCWNCHSVDVHWSRSRGIDGFYKLFGVLVYRCRRCHRRFHACAVTEEPDEVVG